MELSLPGAKVPPMELSLPGAKVPGSESSIIHGTLHKINFHVNLAIMKLLTHPNLVVCPT